MGNYFAHMFIRQNQQSTVDAIKHTLLEHFATRNVIPCDADKADFSVMLDMSDPTWIAVYSEGWGHEDLLAVSPQVSERCGTDVLSCACFDSDYMFLHLYNAESATDAFINIGSSYEIKPPRRSGLAAWKSHVKDFNAFKQAAKQSYVCAEDFLLCMKEQLSLPYQICFDKGSAIALYFSVPQDQKPQPTRLRTYTVSSLPCKPEEPEFWSVRNVGGASCGLDVLFIGSYLENDEITFDDVSLCYENARGERIDQPLTFEKTMLTTGVPALVANVADFQIPAAPSSKLPPRVLSEKEFARSFGIRFTPNGNVRKFLDITVAFLPHANPAQGQCVWNVWKRYNTKTEYIEAYNRGQQEEYEMYGVPMNLIEPDMYDLD
jgi:hypothetical protein